MARKRKLADLVRSEVQRPPEQTTEVTNLPTSEVTESNQNRLPKLQTAKVTESKAKEIPKYLTLMRKETRLREDQIEKLILLTRQLNRQRQGQGERITENTLIRVAVDLLLSQSEQLQGNTEEELKAGLGLD